MQVIAPRQPGGKLAVSAISPHKDHHIARHLGRTLGRGQPFDQAQRQIDARGDARTAPDPAILHKQSILQHPRRWAELRQLPTVGMVGGTAAPDYFLRFHKFPYVFTSYFN